MASDTIGRLAPLEFSSAELEQPVSLTENGHIATIRDLIVQSGSHELRRRFNLSALSAEINILPVKKLDKRALKHLAVAVLAASDAKTVISSVDGDDLSPMDLIGEVERETLRGKRVINGVRTIGILVENAIIHGKLVPR